MSILSIRNDGSVRLSARAHKQIDRFQIMSMKHTPRVRLTRHTNSEAFQSDRPGNIITSLMENNTIIVDDKLQEEIALGPYSKQHSLVDGTDPDPNNNISSLPSGLDEEDVNRRNFYLTLFRIYSKLPFDDCMSSLSNIYNDVFTQERPSTVQKYFLTEVQVVEMNQASEDDPAEIGVTHTIPFRYNFSSGTSKELNYPSSHAFQIFLNKAIRQIKRSDLALGSSIDLHKRGRKAHG